MVVLGDLGESISFDNCMNKFFTFWGFFDYGGCQFFCFGWNLEWCYLFIGCRCIFNFIFRHSSRCSSLFGFGILDSLGRNFQ